MMNQLLRALSAWPETLICRRSRGVETDRQRQILEDLQCDTYQGYLALPLPLGTLSNNFLERKYLRVV